MKRTMIAAVLMLAAPMVAQAEGPQVPVAQGTLEGVRDYTVDSFKGIPYAAPPVGQLRWRAPQPAAAWSGVRVADHFAPDCMQQTLPWTEAPSTVKPSEDCLYLNVWRPAGAAVGQKLPVMVWIHGGGFDHGGTSPGLYDGTAFARDGVILVSVNYRLGRFGFFGFPALTKENADHGDLGNYAFMDQIAALKWVRANIAAFGGDPDNVTLFGESAGGMSVHALLTSPEAKGLFKRAIIQSGLGRIGPNGARRLSAEGKPTSAEALGVDFARDHGITGTDAAALDALRALPAEAVTNDRGDTFAGQMIDGQVVAETDEAAYAAGRINAEAIMIGANSADAGKGHAASKDEAFQAFGPLATRAKAAYDPDGALSLDALNQAVGADAEMVEPARMTAQRATQHGVTVYQYRFNYVASQKRATSPLGVPHAAELPFVFETLDARYGEMATAEDHDMARLTHAAWVAFAKGEAPWPVWTPAGDTVMIFTSDARTVVEPDPLKARLDVTQAKAEGK